MRHPLSTPARGPGAGLLRGRLGLVRRMGRCLALLALVAPSFAPAQDLSGSPAGQPEACPPAVAPLTPAEQRALAPQARDIGFAWRLTKDGRSSHLVGTLHLGRPAWTVPGPRLREILARSDLLALELDLSDAQTIRELQAGMAATSADAPLPPPLARRLARATARACLPAGALEGQRPLLRAVTLALLEARWEGLDAAFSQEAMLMAETQRRGLPRVALETPADQLAALLSPGAADGERVIAQALDQLDSGAARRAARRLAQVWSEGRLDELSAYERWCECADTEDERAWLRRLNDARNPLLAERIDRLHARGHRVLAAVGALHMTGPQALTTLLAQRGFTVERLVSLAP